jgi:hypothetical protein
MAQNEREEKAKVSGKSIGKLTVDLDTTDAVTALKALQRHARETTKVLREVEDAAKQPDIAVTFGGEKIGIAAYDGDVRVDQRYVGDLTTAELADELARREGVEEYRVDEHGGKATLFIDNGTEGSNTPIDGSARSFVVNGG